MFTRHQSWLFILFLYTPTIVWPLEIDLSFLTADDFRSGLKIAARELAKLGLKKIWEINHFKGDVVGKAVNRRQSGRVAQSARVGSSYRWPNAVIPYALSRSYDSYERAMIARAMQAYHDNTCIRFVPRSTEYDYLKIGKYDGCYSDVGRSGGRQILSLDDGCLVYRTILHELMHAVGFWHEHERPDRDDYVEIVWPNIRSGARSQFSKNDPSESNVFGEAYDYHSIMHYDARSFSRNGRPTMLARQPGMTEIMGKSPYFSPSDLRRINALYNCYNTHARPVYPQPPPVQPPPGTYDYGNGDDYYHVRPPPATKRPRIGFRLKLPFGLCKDFGSDCARWSFLCHQPFISIPLKFACAKTCGAC